MLRWGTYVFELLMFERQRDANSNTDEGNARQIKRNCRFKLVCLRLSAGQACQGGSPTKFLLISEDQPATLNVNFFIALVRTFRLIQVSQASSDPMKI